MGRQVKGVLVLHSSLRKREKTNLGLNHPQRSSGTFRFGGRDPPALYFFSLESSSCAIVAVLVPFRESLKVKRYPPLQIGLGSHSSNASFQRCFRQVYATTRFQVVFGNATFSFSSLGSSSREGRGQFLLLCTTPKQKSKVSPNSLDSTPTQLTFAPSTGAKAHALPLFLSVVLTSSSASRRCLSLSLSSLLFFLSSSLAAARASKLKSCGIVRGFTAPGGGGLVIGKATARGSRRGGAGTEIERAGRVVVVGLERKGGRRGAVE